MAGPHQNLPPGFLRQLRRSLPAAAIATDPATLEAHSGDKWFASHRPDLVVFPETTGHVAALFRAATHWKIPVTPRGAGHGYVGGCVPLRGGVLVSLHRMNRILEISPSDFVAVVQPGVITGDLQARVRKKGLYYPPDPASLHHCSLGGNVATNAGGPKCLKYGVTRSYVLGLEVVLPDGSVITAGGRTHKNKTGFDLVGLFCGSEGLLGTITGITLRLIPHPPARATLSAGFSSMPRAAKAIQNVFRAGFLPAAMEVADAFTIHAARNFRPEAHFPPGDAQVIVEIDGQENSVRGESRDIEAILNEAGALRVDRATTEEGCEALWECRRLYSQSLKASGLKKLNEDVVVPRGRLVDLVRFAGKMQRESGFPIACFGHAGDGNIHVNIMIPPDPDAATEKKSRKVLDALFRQVLEWNGAITGEHGIGIAKMPWWKSAVDAPTRSLHQTLRSAIDPNGILNPGKFT